MSEVKYSVFFGGLFVFEGNVLCLDIFEVNIYCKMFRGIFRLVDMLIKCFCGWCRREVEVTNFDATILWEANRWE